MSHVKAIISKHMITPEEVIDDGIVIVEGEKIAAAGQRDSIPIPNDAEVLDFGDKVISPGFVDIHVHGILGHRSEESIEAALSLSQYIVKYGTTSFLPTVQIAEGVKRVVAAKRKQVQECLTGADIAGIHMEGPFLAPKNLPGAEHADDKWVKPSIEVLKRCCEDSEGLIKIMGIAIELEGAHEIVKELVRLNIVPSAAHTKASYETFKDSLTWGIRHATHIFNVMTGMHHRRPGVVGGVLTSDQVTCELIGDGFHVHPAAMDVVIRCKGPDKVALITDLTIRGLAEGEHGSIIVKDGIARIKGADENMDNTMAGSMWPINMGIRNVVKLGYPLHTAVKMASLTPARIAGIDKTKGSLEPGKDADITIIDDDVNIYMTMVKGRTIF